MIPVDESLFAPDRKPIDIPKGVDGVVVNVRRVAQEPFYGAVGLSQGGAAGIAARLDVQLGLTERILREWDSSSVGYVLLGSLAILADHLIAGLMLKWNVLYHRLWTSNRTATAGAPPCGKPGKEPNPILAALFDAYLAHPEEQDIEQLLAHENVRKTYEHVS